MHRLGKYSVVSCDAQVRQLPDSVCTALVGCSGCWERCTVCQWLFCEHNPAAQWTLWQLKLCKEEKQKQSSDTVQSHLPVLRSKLWMTGSVLGCNEWLCWFNISTLWINTDWFIVTGSLCTQSGWWAAQPVHTLNQDSDSPWFIGHVLRQVGEQHSHGESDVLGRVVEAVSELCEVHLAIVVGIHTHHNVLYLLTENTPRSVIFPCCCISSRWWSNTQHKAKPQQNAFLPC